MMTTNTKILQNIGRNIRKYREQKGWSQEELAFECGLHRTYIGSIERGERNITVLNLITIQNKLEVKISDLFPRSEEHTSELQSRFDLVCRLLLEKKNTERKTK